MATRGLILSRPRGSWLSLDVVPGVLELICVCVSFLAMIDGTGRRQETRTVKIPDVRFVLRFVGRVKRRVNGEERRRKKPPGPSQVPVAGRLPDAVQRRRSGSCVLLAMGDGVLFWLPCFLVVQERLLVGDLLNVKTPFSGIAVRSPGPGRPSMERRDIGPGEVVGKLGS